MSEHIMKQSKNNNFVNTIDLQRFADNFDKNYSIKINSLYGFFIWFQDLKSFSYYSIPE